MCPNAPEARQTHRSSPLPSANDRGYSCYTVASCHLRTAGASDVRHVRADRAGAGDTGRAGVWYSLAALRGRRGVGSVEAFGLGGLIGYPDAVVVGKPAAEPA